MSDFMIGDKQTQIEVSGKPVILPAQLVNKLITAEGGDANLVRLTNILNGTEVVNQTAEPGTQFGKNVAVFVNGQAVILPQKLIDAMGGVDALTNLQGALDKAGVGDKPGQKVSADIGEIRFEPLPAFEKIKPPEPPYRHCGPGHGTEPGDPVRRLQLAAALEDFNGMVGGAVERPLPERLPEIPRKPSGPGMA